jgi:serine/threonine-protein kinase
MERLDGETLAARLARVGRLGLTEALDLFLPILAAVAAAHQAGVIHRDIKPSNIVLSTGPAGRVWPKVVDFGLSKVLANDGERMTASDRMMGTAGYMSPEHVRNMRSVSFASDQYALAVVLYQCLTGELPFSGEGFELLEAIMTAPVLAPSQRVGGLPKALDAIILRAIDRDAPKRFAALRAFGAALLPFASENARAQWAPELGGPIDGPAIATPGSKSEDGMTLDGSRATGAFERRRGIRAGYAPLKWIVAGAALTLTIVAFFRQQPRASVGHVEPEMAREMAPVPATPPPGPRPAESVRAEAVATTNAAPAPQGPQPTSRIPSPSPPQKPTTAPVVPAVHYGNNGAPILP